MIYFLSKERFPINVINFVLEITFQEWLQWSAIVNFYCLVHLLPLSNVNYLTCIMISNFKAEISSLEAFAMGHSEMVINLFDVI